MKVRPMIVAGTFVLVAAIMIILLVPAASGKNPKKGVAKEHELVSVTKLKLEKHREATWYWQDTMFRPRTPYAGHEQTTKSRKYLEWLKRKWYKRRLAAKKQAENPPHLSAWLCIHKYEGSWTDPNAPYYGGLQMDMSFQRSYGWRLLMTKGTADNWTPLEQMWVAEQAYASGRGFGPWPNTARYCGLI